MTDSRSRRSIGSNAALAFASLLFALVLCELGMRVADISFPRFERPDALLGESLLPYAEGRFDKEGHSSVRINSAGFRDREHPLVAEPGTLRFAVLGDSFTEARHVELDETFVSVAERELASCHALAGRRPEFMNFGMSGYGTVQELLLMRQRVFDYHPDWVVLAFFVGNDLRNNTKPLQKGGRPYFVYQDDKLVLDDSFNRKFGSRLRTGPLGRAFYALVPHVRVLQLFLEAGEARRRDEIVARLEEERRTDLTRLGEAEGAEPGLDDQVYKEPQDADWQLAWRTSEDLIRMMRDEVRAHGARFLLMTVNASIQVHPDPATRQRYAARLGVDDLLYPDRRLRDFAASEGFDALTLAPLLRKRAENTATCLHGFDNTLPCSGHWNREGHRAAGEELARALCRKLAD